jgi:CelD/BcsL family acetyltransferase involved in cellulose biosynthesis
MYKTTIVDALGQCDDLADSWHELLADSKNPTVFNTFAWARCWLQVYWEPDYTLRIILVYDSEKLVALLPLYIQRKTGTCWVIGSGEPEAEEVASEYLDFIVRENHLQSAGLADCIKEQLEILGKYRLILVNCCASSYAASLLMNHRRAIHDVSGAVYKLPIQDSFANTAATFSKNQLRKARQCLSRFNAGPTIEYLSFHSDNFLDDWNTLQTLHQKDWTARGQNGAFHSARFSRFHHLMNVEHPEIEQAFAAVRKDSETLAIHHFYVFGGNYYFYLAGTEKTRESRLSPGLLLHVLAMQELSGKAVTYDFLKGSTPNSYKAKFCRPGDEFYTITLFENTIRGGLRQNLVRLKRCLKNLRKAGGKSSLED